MNLAFQLTTVSETWTDNFSRHLTGRCLAVFLLAWATFTPIARAQDDAAEDSAPAATTTGNPEISIDHLRLLLKPMTKEELVVEADAWRDLLKEKLQEVSALQISLLESKAAPAEDDGGQTDTPSGEAEEADSSAGLVQLQDQQANLTDRLNAVANALEKKGGDVESYRQYVSAVSGIELNVSDASGTWLVLKSWAQSEQGGRRWLWNIIKFLVILAAFYFGASFVASLARHATSRVKGSSQLLVNFVGTVVKQALMVLGFIVSLSALEVNITPLLTAVGAAGFVIGLALQGTLSNFASGLLILFYRPFDVGDVIDAGGVSGIVNSVSLVSTQIRTFDNKIMIVPNNDVWGGTITNATASDTRRIDMVFGIGYEDDIEVAKGILERLVKEHELILEDPEPVIQLNELGDSSVNFICRPWSKTGDYWTVYWDLTRQVKEEFDKNNISIPYPQRDVHLIQSSASDT